MKERDKENKKWGKTKQEVKERDNKEKEAKGSK